MTALLEPEPKQAHKQHEGDFVVMRDVPVWKEHTNRDGVPFGPRELRQVCDRCNERIEDTGDFCPVVLRHTTDDGDRDPQVIGFAGPFRMGVVGDRKPKAAILATLRIYSEDAEMLRRYPRLSVEYWADEDDPTNGYFDPISLLGAETPELDLGIRYSAGDHGRRVLRYSKVLRFEATAPGGSNTYVPGGTDDDKETYSKDDPMTLSEQDLAQLTAALQETIQAMVADAVAAAQTQPEELPEEEGLSPYGKMCKYMADEDEAGADEFYGGLDEDGLSSLSGELESDEDEDRRGQMTAYMARYMADDSCDEDKPSPEKYAKLKADAADYRQKYQKEVTMRRQAETELQDLKSRVGKIEADGKRAVRYQKLTSLQAEGYLVEPDEEIQDVAALTDDAFEKHCDRIVTKYQRVPLDTLPVPASQKYDGRDRKSKSEKYAKQAAAKVQEARKKGEKLDYATVLNELIEADTDA